MIQDIQYGLNFDISPGMRIGNLSIDAHVLRAQFPRTVIAIHARAL
jgi:hypothetical protein